MAAERTKYQIVGKYINQADARETLGYHITSSDGKSRAVTTEQLAYLVGRGQISNCNAQIYKDKLIFKGVGISLDSLPKKAIAGRTKSGRVQQSEPAPTATPVPELVQQQTTPVQQTQSKQNRTIKQEQSKQTSAFTDEDKRRLEVLFDSVSLKLGEGSAALSKIPTNREFVGLFKLGGNERYGLPAVRAIYDGDGGTTEITLHFAKSASGKILVRACPPRSATNLGTIELEQGIPNLRQMAIKIAYLIHDSALKLTQRQAS